MIIPIFEPLKAPRRRTSANPPPALPTGTVTIGDVYQDSPTVVGWSFSDTVVDAPDISVFLVDGEAPDTLVGIEDNTIRLQYASNHFGDPWSITSDGGLTFASGESLAVPESGTVD